MYNPSIAKFLSVDPLAPEYPWYSPYHFAGNTPIRAIDVDGLEPMDINNNPTNDPSEVHHYNWRKGEGFMDAMRSLRAIGYEMPWEAIMDANWDLVGHFKGDPYDQTNEEHMHLNTTWSGDPGDRRSYLILPKFEKWVKPKRKKKPQIILPNNFTAESTVSGSVNAGSTGAGGSISYTIWKIPSKVPVWESGRRVIVLDAGAGASTSHIDVDVNVSLGFSGEMNVTNMRGFSLTNHLNSSTSSSSSVTKGWWAGYKKIEGSGKLDSGIPAYSFYLRELALGAFNPIDYSSSEMTPFSFGVAAPAVDMTHQDSLNTAIKFKHKSYFADWIRDNATKADSVNNKALQEP